MNIYFIANRKFNDTEIINFNNLKPKESDIIVRYNGGEEERLFNNRTDLIFTRCKGYNCQGFDEKYHHKQKNNFLLYIIKANEVKIPCEKEILQNNNLKIKYIDKDLNIFKKHKDIIDIDLTTGFYSIEYLLDKHKNKIDNYYLLGFNFFKNDPNKIKEHEDIHDFKYEYDYFKDKLNDDKRMIWFE